MGTLILSGMGSSAPNWLPLLSPLVAVVVIVYAYQVTVRYIQRRKAVRLHQLTEAATMQMDAHEPGSDDGMK